LIYEIIYFGFADDNDDDILTRIIIINILTYLCFVLFR